MIMIRNFLKITLTGFLLSSSLVYADTGTLPAVEPKPLTTINEKPEPVAEKVLTGAVLEPKKVLEQNGILDPKAITKVEAGVSEIDLSKKNLNPFLVDEKLREEKIRELKKLQVERRLKLGIPIAPVVVAKSEEEVKKENENKILEAINVAKVEKQEKREKELASKIADPEKSRYIGVINGKRMYQDLTTSEYFSVE